jgi:hypothetical protein
MNHKFPPCLPLKIVFFLSMYGFLEAASLVSVYLAIQAGRGTLSHVASGRGSLVNMACCCVTVIVVSILKVVWILQ